MKKLTIAILLLLSLAAFSPFTHQTNSNATADVLQMEGCYIFTDCKPVSQYDYLGTVELTPRDIRKTKTYSSQYQNVRDALVKKIKSKYPAADGSVMHLHDGGIDKADAIKFK